MKYSFEELVDIKQVQKLTDALFSAFQLPSAVITIEGKIVTGSGWQKICTEFHRKNPETEKDCIESDTRILEMIKNGEKYSIYSCPRGLTDSSSPVFIDGRHLANVFTGQFFTHPPTEETEQHFRKQARKYGFDEEAYIAAFREIPIFPEYKHRHMLDVLVEITEMLSSMGLTRLRALKATEALRESNLRFRSFDKYSTEGIYRIDFIKPVPIDLPRAELINWMNKYSVIGEVNNSLAKMYGLEPENMINQPVVKFAPDYGVRAALVLENEGAIVRYEETTDVDKNGDTLYFLENYQGIIENNFLVAIWGAQTDITKLKLSERELQYSKQDLVESQRIAKLGSWRIDLASNEVVWSEGIYKMYGLDPTLPPPPLAEQMKLFTPESWDRISNAIAKTSETGNTYELELEIVREDRSNGWMWGRGEAVKNANGNVVGLRGAAQDITERKQIELELISSKKRLDIALLSADLGMWDLNLVTQELSWSDLTYKLFDKNIEDFTPSFDTFAKLVHPEDAETMQTNFNNALQDDKKTYHVTIRIINDTGREWVMEAYGKVTRNSKGEAIAIVGTAQDITERKKTEEILRSKQYHLVNAQALGKIGSWDLDITKNELKWTDENYKVFGLPIGTPLTYEIFLSRVHPDDREYVDKKWTAAVRREEAYDITHRLMMDDGEVKWVREKADLVFNDEGKCLRGDGFTQDITPQKMAEEKLRDAEARLQKTFDISPGLICVADINTGHFVEVNEAVKTTLGFTIEEFTSKPFMEFIHPDDRQRTMDEIAEQLKGSNTTHFENRYLTKDGSYKWLSWQTTAADKNGKVYAVATDVSMSKQAQEELSKSEALFRTIVTNSMPIIFRLDTEGKILLSEGKMLTSIGLRPGEVVGQSAFELYKDFPDTIAVFRKVLGGENFEGIIDFGERTFELFCSPITDSSGKVEGIIGMSLDITERKQAEEQLKESQVFTESLLKTSPDIIYIYDIIEQKNVYSNEGIWKVLGYSIEEIRNMGGNVLPSLMHPDDFQNYLNSILPRYQSAKDEELIEHEYRMKHKNGNWRWLFSKESIFTRMNDGTPKQIFGITGDITERKKAENELFKSKAKLQQINNQLQMSIDHMPNAYILWDSNLCVMEWNKAAEKIFGYSKEEMLGENPVNYIVPEPVRHLVNDVMKHLKVGEVAQYSEKNNNIRKDGKTISCQWTNTPLVNQNGDVIGILTLAQDITERILAEEAAIESQRLGAIGEMSSAVAHDFNNSLQSIFGNLELALLDSGIPEYVRERLETIKKATSDAATRVQLLQRFGGKQQIDSQYSLVNINDVVKEVIIQSRPFWKDEMEKSGLQITLEQNLKEVKNIKGNKAELRSVVYNVIKNSVEAMPAGGSISIETGVTEDVVSVSITDSGKGMDDEVKSRIFQPFFSTKGFDAGRGLGLSGTYSIIQEHGGKIFVKETAPGRGSTIEILLPVSDAREESTEIVEVDKKFKGSARVLWVDDEKMIRESGIQMLKKMGHKGDAAGSGEEALKYLDENEYDLIVTDIGMPGMNGWQLADAIKAKFNGKMLIAILSGWGAEIDMNKKKEHCVNFVLAKPFRIKELQKLIAEVMGSADK